MRRALALVFVVSAASATAGCGAGEGVQVRSMVVTSAASKGIAQSRLSLVELTACRLGRRGAEFEGRLHNKADVTSSFNVSVIWRDEKGALLDRTDAYKMAVKPGEVVPIDGFGLVSAKALGSKRLQCEVSDIDRIETDI